MKIPKVRALGVRARRYLKMENTKSEGVRCEG